MWRHAIGQCNTLGRETVSVDEIAEALAARSESYNLDRLLAELAASELVQMLPHGHVRLLARLDLWAFDDDAVDW